MVASELGWRDPIEAGTRVLAKRVNDLDVASRTLTSRTAPQFYWSFGWSSPPCHLRPGWRRRLAQPNPTTRAEPGRTGRVADTRHTEEGLTRAGSGIGFNRRPRCRE